jgi:2-amino-1-hydroxyethylphosphonate dioxygenase (glycine-forming)
MTTASNPANVTDDILHLLDERGTGDYIGESISQLEHCLQAANFAAQAGEGNY